MKLEDLNKKVNAMHILKCHCETVKIELTLPNRIENPRRCDCSFCRMRGAIVASVGLDNLKIIEGEENLGLYQFDTMTARHYFCKTCGIYTHHQRRSNPTQFGYNLACLENINPYLLDNVPILDGINHPCDKKRTNIIS